MEATMDSIRMTLKNLPSNSTFQEKIASCQKVTVLLHIVMASDLLTNREKLIFFTEIEELKKSNDNSDTKKSNI